MTILRLLPKIFVALYLSVCFVPIMGAADMATTQMLYISLLNVICVLTFCFVNKPSTFIADLTNYLKVKQFTFFFLFLLWALISTTKSTNLSESFRTISDLLNYFIAFLLFLFNLQRITEKKNFVLNFFLFVLVVEILVILFLFFMDLRSGTFDMNQRFGRYKGLTGNINIAAFSILIKIPLLIYKISQKKFRFFGAILLFCASFVIIYLLKTRAAILTLILLCVLISLYVLVVNRKSPNLNTKPLISVGIIAITFLLSTPLNRVFETDSTVENRLSTLVSSDNNSVNERKRYYKQSFETFLQNPILGIGIGNWEIKSTQTDAENILGYTVPYHAHNDYLELLAETGFLGFTFFYAIIMISLFVLYKRIKVYDDPFPFYLLLAIGGYMADAMFNFPFARPIQQMNLFGVLGLTQALFFSDHPKSKALFSHPIFLKGQLALVLLFLPVALYSSSKVYKAYTEHYYLLGQFNENKYIQDIETILPYEEDYPSILPTTIPAVTVKGMFFLRKRNDFQTAKKYFRKGMIINPYLKLSETMLGYCYLLENKLDSAIYHTRNAFENMPKNPIHFTNYVVALSAKRDTLSIKKAKERIDQTGLKSQYLDQLYLKSMANLLDKDLENIVINEFYSELINSKNAKLRGSIYVLKLGKEIVAKAQAIYREGEILFSAGEIEKAARKFEEASQLNTLETPYLENAINAYLKSGNNRDALRLCEKAYLESKSTNKIKYMKAIIHLDIGETEKACEIIKELLLSDYKKNIPKGLYRAYCN